MWLIDWLSGRFSEKEQEFIHLSARVAELDAVNKFLSSDNELLRARLATFEADEREIRRSLYTRAGLLSAPPKSNGESGELKPVRKVTVPWNVAAARLEADSKERYWKKIIEDREALENRVANAPNAREKSENEQIQEDIEEMSR